MLWHGDPNGSQTIAEELERRGIEVDLLVNNAGFGLSGAFLSHDPKQKQAEIEVNVQALVALTHRFGKAMASRGREGTINVASNASFQPVPYMATYAATKAFVLHFTEAIRHELAERGVQVAFVAMRKVDGRLSSKPAQRRFEDWGSKDAITNRTHQR